MLLKPEMPKIKGLKHNKNAKKPIFDNDGEIKQVYWDNSVRCLLLMSSRKTVKILLHSSHHCTIPAFTGVGKNKNEDLIRLHCGY